MSKSKKLLYIGQPGLGMLDAARQMAKQYIQDERLVNNPDYLEIGLSGKSIGTGELDDLVNFSSFTAYGKGKAVVVDHFDSLTIAGQNRLLKTIEDSNMLIIAIAYDESMVLPTIRNRMERRIFLPLSEEEFSQYCKDKGYLDVKLLYVVTGGCIGMIDDVCSALEVFRRTDVALRNRDMKGLIEALGLVFCSESVKEDIYSCHSELLAGLLRLMTATWLELLHKGCKTYSEEELRACIIKVSEEKRNIRSVSYCRNDFFAFIVGLWDLKGVLHGKC